MRVDFTFDEKIMEAAGYTMADVYGTIKGEFRKRNVSCVSEGQVLSFAGGTGRDDFSEMWAVILMLTKSDWFMKFATSCIWIDNDGNCEDVLRQVLEC